MDFDAEQAEALIDLMEQIGAEPKWSGATDNQLRNFFKLVLLGPSDDKQ